MPKRKLSELTDSSKDGKLHLQTTRLTNKFHHGATALSRALKTARGFERQKLGRREKTAKEQKNEETLARLAEEIKVLKALDLQAVAERHIFKQLVKTKRIAESQAFAHFRESSGKIAADARPQSTAEANVTARLYKSNPVQKVMPEIMSGIKRILGLDDAPASGKQAREEEEEKKAKSKEEGSRKKHKRDGHEEEEDDDDVKSKTNKAPISKDAEESRSGSEDEDEDEDNGDVDMDDAESIDFAQFDSLVASDSGSDDDDDDEQGGIALPSKPKTNTTGLAYNPADADDVSLSPSRSPSPSFEEEEEYVSDEAVSDEAEHSSSSPPTKKSKKISTTTKEPPKSTTFLPSLMMGGYWSGSESDDDAVDVTEPPRRKNRMGQQARRALWEKKFGAKANHLQQQKKKKNQGGRDSGWDLRRGALTDADGENGKWGNNKGRGGMRNNKKVGGDNNPNLQKMGDSRLSKGGVKKGGAVNDDKPLHPSWEAARKAKEQKAQASFQGKKITFD